MPYRGGMADFGHPGPDPNPRFGEDLVGLDPYDPEARAFAEHLDRMERCGPTFTVEASISGVADFAESSNRLGGLRWWASVALVSLIIIGVIVAAWDIIGRAMIWLSS
ncbi:MAG: hypothetical protein QOI21_3322 [Actinomycetota bacterium]|nr:hypothetical protein [Actinomycetota bacterium]